MRNLSVSGSIYGRRMVGGIVGRTGSIPTGIYLENCANHASVKNTDSKGVGGIVGAGWSEGAIVNCYNTGSVTTQLRHAAWYLYIRSWRAVYDQ